MVFTSEQPGNNGHDDDEEEEDEDGFYSAEHVSTTHHPQRRHGSVETPTGPRRRVSIEQNASPRLREDRPLLRIAASPISPEKGTTAATTPLSPIPGRRTTHSGAATSLSPAPGRSSMQPGTALATGMQTRMWQGSGRPGGMLESNFHAVRMTCNEYGATEGGVYGSRRTSLVPSAVDTNTNVHRTSQILQPSSEGISLDRHLGDYAETDPAGFDASPPRLGSSRNSFGDRVGAVDQDLVQLGQRRLSEARRRSSVSCVPSIGCAPDLVAASEPSAPPSAGGMVRRTTLTLSSPLGTIAGGHEALSPMMGEGASRRVSLGGDEHCVSFGEFMQERRLSVSKANGLGGSRRQSGSGYGVFGGPFLPGAMGAMGEEGSLESSPESSFNSRYAGSRRASAGICASSVYESLGATRTRRASLGGESELGLAAFLRANEERRWAAASVIQRCWKGRKARKLWRGAVDKLRSAFIDPRAQAAGAEDSPWYTDAALAARDALREDKAVGNALDDAWRAVAEASGRLELGTLIREDYLTMSRKIYLATKHIDGAGDVSIDDFGEAEEEDWEADAGGADELSEEAFKACWFELADVHTDSISAEDYAEWIRMVVAEVIAMEDPKSEEDVGSSTPATLPDPINAPMSTTDEEPATAPGRRWRRDSELLEAIRARSGMSAKAFSKRASLWCTVYETETIWAAPEERRKSKRPSVGDERRQSAKPPEVGNTAKAGARQPAPPTGAKPASPQSSPRRLSTTQAGQPAKPIPPRRSIAGEVGRHDSVPTSTIASSGDGSSDGSFRTMVKDSPLSTMEEEVDGGDESFSTYRGSSPARSRPSSAAAGTSPALLRQAVVARAAQSSAEPPPTLEQIMPNDWSRPITAPNQVQGTSGTPAAAGRGTASAKNCFISPEVSLLKHTSYSRRLSMLPDGCWPLQILRQAGAPGMPLPHRPANREGLDAQRLPRLRDDGAGVTLDEWHGLMGRTRVTSSSPGGSLPAPQGFASSHSAAFVRPASRGNRPWTRGESVLEERVVYCGEAVDVASACNRLITDISARCTMVSRDTGWPCVDVYAWCGSHLMPLPMQVLAHSAATRMRDIELGARLSAYARKGLDDAQLAELIVRVALPSQAVSDSTAATPSSRLSPTSTSFRAAMASDIKLKINAAGACKASTFSIQVPDKQDSSSPPPQSQRRTENVPETWSKRELSPEPLQHLAIEPAFDTEVLPSKKIRMGGSEFGGGGGAGGAHRRASFSSSRRGSMAGVTRAEAIGAARSRRSSAVGLG